MVGADLHQALELRMIGGGRMVLVCVVVESISYNWMLLVADMVVVEEESEEAKETEAESVPIQSPNG